MKGKDFYVNGMDRTLDDSLKRMKTYNRRYLRDSGTVIAAEKGLLSRESLNQFSTKKMKGMVLQRIEAKGNLLNNMGRLPILCKDGLVRTYDPARWAETMARSRSRALQEEGLHNQMSRAGFDLVIVSIGGSKDECTNWEGQILSITGQTPGFPTVDEAQATGEVFHFRCTHNSTPFLLTEDENGPRVWGRDDLTPKAQEQLKQAGVLRTGTIKTGLKTFYGEHKTPVNMLDTELKTTLKDVALKTKTFSNNVSLMGMLAINLNTPVYVINDAMQRFPFGKFNYFGDANDEEEVSSGNQN